MLNRARPARSTFEHGYAVVIAITGFDGLIEFVAGLILLVAPRLTGSALEALAAELAEGTPPLRDAAASSIAAADGGLVTGTAPLAVFLLVHGLAKLLTVTALLRRAIRCSPRALTALSVLLVVQLADLDAAPAVGGTVLAVLDVVVITLVTWEYRRLRRERAVPAEQEVRPGRIERASAR
ncbi:DUF2127 domain-containing protein [uncultured Amnibacterium sp.]|uniref:DUF2127 domain-containing protein n=1 Tax=uncultured Amnibacterium sp. TaxID=1631851 RepID=UPI0035CA8849